MSDDLLQRAAKALRDEADAGGETAAGGRRRVLDGIQAQRRAAARRTAVLVPMAALLVTSTAIAAASGALPGVWQAIRKVVAPASETPPDRQGPGHGEGRGDERRRQARTATNPQNFGPKESEIAAEQPVVVEPTVQAPALAAEDLAPAVAADTGPGAGREDGQPRTPQAATPPRPRDEATRAPASARQPAQAQTQAGESKPAAARSRPTPAREEAGNPSQPGAAQPQPSPAPQAQPEPGPSVGETAPVPPPPQPQDGLALFRQAQRLQFHDKRWAEALAAWEAYLRDAPKGALAPEARWNRAVCLVRLGRTEEARKALEPFAHAPEGSYRQADAKALLEALDGAAR